MRLVLIVLLGSALLVSLSTATAHAQSAAQTLGTCLADNTTGKDRKDLARWIFTALAAHPEIESLSAVTDAGREEASRDMGLLFTRLLSESCPEEVRIAVDREGGSVIGAAFEILGRVAMQELMHNDQVSSAMEGVAPFIDTERLQAVMQPE
jgi:hypothetical protein